VVLTLTDDSMINFRAIFDGVLASILFAVTLMQAPAKKKKKRRKKKWKRCKARQVEFVEAESFVAEEEVMPAPKQARIISKAFPSRLCAVTTCILTLHCPTAKPYLLSLTTRG
jgi:hypothetical protein